MTAPLATPDALSAFIGAPIDPTRAQQLLTQATGIIQEWTNQYLLNVTGDTVIVDPNSDGWASVPELPVNDVASFEYLDDRDGVWYTYDTSVYRWNRYGKIYLVQQPDYWPWQLDSLRVTYSHGYNPIPNGLAGVCIQLAARLFANPYDAQRYTTGGVQVGFSGTKGTDELRDTEKIALGRYTVVEVS